jgi:hypothetical protein
MKREASLLLTKALDSLLLSIGRFNGASDRGRVTSVLIMLDHAFEMLLKATLLHRGGRIREPRKRETLGFDMCIRKGLSEGPIKFLTEEQAITLQTINGLRDAAQHHLIDVSEPQLYMHAQSGVTLFRDLLDSVFGRSLADFLPSRVLPVSTMPPVDLEMLFDSEIEQIAKLLVPGKRRKTEALARIRPLAILDATVQGEKLQPSDADLKRIAKEILAKKSWGGIFPGVASIQLTTDGQGAAVSLRITKKKGVPVQLVPEGTPGGSVVAIKRVDELGFYNLGRDQLAKNIGLSGPKTTALVQHLNLSGDPECFKEITIGKSKFKRYSQKAIERLLEAKNTEDMDRVWKNYNRKS